MVVFTGKSNAKEVKIGLKVSATLNKAERNQHLQFTAEIWMTKKNSPTPAKEEIVQIVTNNKFPFLELKMIWSPEGDLQFSVFRKQGQQLKYVVKQITHTPGTLCAIPSGVLKRLSKLASKNSPFILRR